MMRGQRVVVVLSGGQDSTTCLYIAKNAGCEIHAVTFDYGQRHSRELIAAANIADMAAVESHEIIRLGPILKGTSPLVSNAPLEQYKDHASLPGGLENTFVPMRNQLFLTIAANRAYVLGCNDLVTGVSGEDYGGYPDCRRHFIDSFEKTSTLGTFTGEKQKPVGLYVHTPLMHLTKEASVHLAVSLPGCYGALAFSHTSYDGSYPPVGKDHATLLRAKGFEAADVPDPLILRAYLEGAMALPITHNYKCELFEEYLTLVKEALSHA
jgi:7-cyano-7-deazaguanine synthase